MLEHERLRPSIFLPMPLSLPKRNFSEFANFQVCGITDLSIYEGDRFDLITCSEVLEHIKEYGKERDTLLGPEN